MKGRKHKEYTPESARLEFIALVVALSRVLRIASIGSGTSPHPATSNDGAGITSGCSTFPCSSESNRFT